jgi:trehalose synthase
VLPTVPLPSKRLDDYGEACGPATVERLREVAKPLAGARVLHLNSTAFGGGVAELLHTQLPLFSDLGIDATWAVMQGSDDYFLVTKAIHNGLQGAEVPWTNEMINTYLSQVKQNAKELKESYDFVFVHDPQPAAVLSCFEEEGRRSGNWLWRCHIDLSKPHLPVWEFFAPIVNRYDAAIFTLEEFAQSDVQGPRLAFIPPSIDPLSTKNMYLREDTAYEVLQRYGIDRSRPIITQVSRFDPWKDPIGVIDAFRIARKEVDDLQLVMVGSMAHDDPEGWHYLNITEEHREGDPDIHLLTNFQDVGSLEVNAFQRESTVVLQKSIREGFGLVVSEAMWKERAVIAGNVGGIRLQIEDGVNGFLVDDVEECGARIVELLKDPALRNRMGKAAKKRVRDRFLTLRELQDQLELMVSLT